MNNKYLKLFTVICCLLLCKTEIAAQPYYFFHYRTNGTLNSVNLKAAYYNFSNKSISYLPFSNDLKSININYLFDLNYDGTQRWLVSGYNKFQLYDLLTNTKTMDLPSGDEDTFINDMVYSGKNNKLFIDYEYDSKYNSQFEKYMYIIDIAGGKIVSKINKPYLNIDDECEKMFLSNDENTLYYYIEDTLAYNHNRYNSDSLCYFSTSSNNIISKIPISQFGYQNATIYKIENGNKGIGIVKSIFINTSSSINDVYYRIYNFDNNTGSNFIHLKGGQTPYFTNAGKYIVFSSKEKYDLDIVAPNGIFNLYEVSTGNLLKTIIFPPRGQVFTFSNFPNQLFYLMTDSTFQNISSYKIDVDSIINALQVPPYLNVKLVNSTGSILSGGSLQYYDGSWKDAVNNNNGTFSINTKLKTVSLRMTYAYGSQTLSNVTVGKDTVVFQTVNAKVKLQNSIGNPIDQGNVQYYAGAWRDFGLTVNGTSAFELLPGNYSFRMTYAFASNDKAQDIGVNSTVIFQTVNSQVQLKNSLGNLIDQGTVQYYSGAWRSLGNTTNGIASMELLPNNYSFRMTHAFASNDKQQDIGANSTVVFQTVNAQVQLKNSLGNLIDQGTVQYYSGAWRTLGTTTNGISTLELLPNSYSFRMTFAFASNDKQQDISANSTVIFQTINAQVQLKNSLGNFIDQGTVQYYSGAWRNLGTTTNGIASIELLSNTYSFRITYGFISKDISQNIALNNVITYSTVLCTVKVNDSQNQPVNNADIKYYSGAWREIGLTSNGVITKELLPANLSFRVNYNSTQKDITQDISINNIVVFGL